MNNLKIGTKTKIFTYLGVLIILLGIVFQGGKIINNWFHTHYFQFNNFFTVIWSKPVEIKKRKLEVTEIVNIVNQIPTLENLDPIEQYICEKWGIYDCKIALAIARAESGMKEGAFNTYNKNGTLDVGIFQINSIHFDKEGCSLKEVADQYKNVDCAYQIYQDSGWTPWVVYNTGAFKNHLNE